MQSEVACRLLQWYDAVKRDLPWRENTDPYRVWVSEIMLQQTRVEAVKPYYARWMAAFPSVTALAAAPEEAVLAAWQGLGYYSRARNLHQAAREVTASYGGVMPSEPAAIQELPGIGEYTAGAIASIAYNCRVPAVDGNVLRIYSRLYRIGEDILSGKVKKQITALVAADIDAARPGDFNQALMDLGSAVCIPGTPRCGDCPLTAVCQALTAGEAHLLPVRRKKKPPTPVKLAAAVIVTEAGVLLQRRPARGLLAGMWEFPTTEYHADEAPAARLEADWRERLGVTLTVEPAAALQVKHVFSHRQWELSFFRAVLPQLPDSLPPRCRWAGTAEWPTVLWAGPHQKGAALVER